MHLLKHAPRFSPEQARDLAEQLYGLGPSRVSELPSERDQNFLLDRADGRRLVLKIANALEEPAFLEAQGQVLARLAPEVTFCPRVVAGRGGGAPLPAGGAGGARRPRRVVFHLPRGPPGRAARAPPPLLP